MQRSSLSRREGLDNVAGREVSVGIPRNNTCETGCHEDGAKTVKIQVILSRQHLDQKVSALQRT